MRLERYHHKRDFSKTTEPRGRIHQTNHHLFFIQKHAASHLHYDFRIELEGVLKSWAVPKGPCLDPNIKRLAMHVEDHPIEYGTFEGIIPKGEYGGGTVLLWDQGTWDPLDKNPIEAYRKGHLRFELHAEKLKGRWDLIHFKSGEQKNTWFLVKKKDEYADSLNHNDITISAPNSVASGKNLEEISEQYKAIWTHGGLKKIEAGKIEPTLPKTPFPTSIAPQLATLVKTPPQGDEWLHEIKLDGYRILAFKHGEKIQLLSRNHKDWTQEFKKIVTTIKKISVGNVILDGEIVILDEKNRSNFQLLQNSIKAEAAGDFIYYVFDLLYYDKWDIRSLPLLERKNILQSVLFDVDRTLRYSDHVIGEGEEVFKHSCEFALEGIISKKAHSPYITNRSKSWLKVKCTKRQEFVIGGFTPPKGSRSHIGSLYLGGP